MKSHKKGTLETLKFEHRQAKYYENLPKIIDLVTEKSDFLHYFPAFCGHMTLNRYLTLYELYKSVLGISGHICEIGVFKGASTLLLGKLIELFEPESLTMVHGIDHFKGTDSSTDSALQVVGGNSCQEEWVRELVRLQGMDNIVKIHNVDATCGFTEFFNKYPHLRFKMVFVDSGTYDVVSESIMHLWPRLNRGGIMIFDQYNHEVAPGETHAVHNLLPNEKIQTLVGSWTPTAFIRKE